MAETMKLREFREAMVAEGMLVDDSKTDEAGRAENAWRLKHLTNMARLVHGSCPEVALDKTTTSQSLYEALATQVPLKQSVAYTIEELLEALEAGEEAQEGVAASGDDYVAELEAAIEASNSLYPWRVGADRSTFTRKHLVSAPPPKSVPPKS